MKISQSAVALSSSYMFEQEAALQEKTSSKTATAGILPSRNRAASKIHDRLPLMVVDRVSISGAAIRETSTAYSHSLSLQSSVWGAGENEAANFSQQEMVEKLVSTVVKEQVSSLSLTDLGTGQPSGSDNLSPGQRPSAKTTITLDRTTSHFEREQMSFASQGQILTEDGRTIDFSLELAMDRTTMTETREQALMSTWQEQVVLIDPLIINLDGGVPALSDTRFEFDLNNDGATEEISFAASGSGFLSFDKNNDGMINNGSELFGPGTGNGFDELAAYDLDGNGWIDENDDVFSKLSVWTRDDAGNDLLVSLADAGIGAVYLGNAGTGFELTDAENALAGDVARSGLFLFENGNVGMIQQIDLAARSTEPEVEVVSESDSQADLPQPLINTAPALSGVLENGTAVSMEQTWQTETKNFLEEMMLQIREMEKQIRRIFNIESKPGDRRGNTNRLFNRIRLHGKGLIHRSGQAF
ncbi:VCBS repeat-containing protein [Desulfobacter curvatus]|uniref:VCBS repeat-containing protein n=1 Tax=Desulfobacter curvatus TaxID=2290 RepID=UPI0003748DD2|nr:VCBS repeat-containing protein [Desulfobacter curvatus]